MLAEVHRIRISCQSCSLIIWAHASGEPLRTSLALSFVCLIAWLIYAVTRCLEEGRKAIAEAGRIEREHMDRKLQRPADATGWGCEFVEQERP